jgi:putative acetyltransferase
MNVYPATTPEDIENTRTLFEEYAETLGFSLCFQNFDQELANLPGKYSPPDGRLLLVSSQGKLAGCIALRRHDNESCEMKRLFVRPEFRGEGIGRVLVDTIIEEARTIGYQKMCLDTVPGKMDKAIGLYEAKGFRDVAPYYDNPVAGTRYLSLDLNDTAPPSPLRKASGFQSAVFKK